MSDPLGRNNFNNAYRNNQGANPNGALGNNNYYYNRANTGQNYGQQAYQGPYQQYQQQTQQQAAWQQQTQQQQQQQNSANWINVPWEQYELVKKKHTNPICRVLLTIGSTITFLRNLVFNTIFVLLIVFFLVIPSLISSFVDSSIFGSKSVADTYATEKLSAEVLYFDLQGSIQEAPFSASPLDNFQRELDSALYGRYSHEILAIEKALVLVKDDPQIKKVILDFDGMGSISMAMVERLGNAIQVAKGSSVKREVVAVGLNYSQAAYALAAYCDRIVLDPLGQIDLKGISMSSLYFKDLLDKAKLTPYIFRAGHFKSAVEPFILNAMSQDVRNEYNAIAFNSWRLYEQSLKVRKKINSTVLPDANSYVQWLNHYAGNRAKMQLAQGLVDDVMPLEQYFFDLSTELNADADKPNYPAIITYQDYLLRYHYKNNADSKVYALSQIDVDSSLLELSALKDAAHKLTHSATTTSTGAKAVSTSANLQAAADTTGRVSIEASSGSRLNNFISRVTSNTHGKKIAVIYGIGEITDFSESTSDFTPDNLVPLIEDAQYDSNTAALVFYINSPGGSVIASEKIRRALEMYKASGKPLIVSMNGTTASGAYWLASQADTIFATSSTITGSIGVFGIGFGAHKLLNHFGAYQDGVYTNELAIQAIGDELPATQQQVLSMGVEKTYQDFIELVAKNRGVDAHDYEIYAEGQIFLANEAKTIGLIDEIGSLDDAIAVAANAANLNSDSYRVEHLSSGANEALSGIESLFFGMCAKYLPDDLNYAILQYRKQSNYLKGPQNQSLMAISPIGSPEL